MIAPPFYLAASDGLPQTTDLGHQHKQGEGTHAASSDPISYHPYSNINPPLCPKVFISPNFFFFFFVKQETIGLRGTEMQKSLSKESSSPKVSAQKNPAPGWVRGVLGGAAQSPEFLPTDKALPFPSGFSPFSSARDGFLIFPFCGHPAVGSFLALQCARCPVRSVGGPARGPLARGPAASPREPRDFGASFRGRPGPSPAAPRPPPWVVPGAYA